MERNIKLYDDPEPKTPDSNITEDPKNEEPEFPIPPKKWGI